MDPSSHQESSDGSILSTELDIEDISVPSGPSWYDDRLLGFDLETTSLDTSEALPVQYAFVLKRSGVPLHYDSKSAIVNPGVEIPDTAAAIHHIDTARARAEGIPLEQAAQRTVQRILWASEQHIPLVGYNLAYDLTIVDRMARQLLGSGLVDRGWCGPVIDVYVLDKQLDMYRSGSRKLVDVAQHYNVGFDGAHDAHADVVGTLNVLLAMIEQYDLLQSPLDEWWQCQIEWRKEQCASYSEYRVGRGQPPVPAHEYHWPIYDFGASG